MDRQSVVRSLLAIMAEEGKGKLAKFIEQRQLLIYAMFGRMEKVPPKLMLVHPSNRGNTGLNCHNAHRNGLKIHKAGADLSLLSHACAIEIRPEGAPHAEKRKHLFEFNDALVRASNNKLAPVSGLERFASLATSHTFAFCKAAEARCSTDYAEIADSAGRLDPALLGNNNNMKTMMEEGWDVFVVPYWIEDDIKNWPHWCQSACNVTNAAKTVMSEVETMSSLVEDIMAMQGDVPNWQAAKESVESDDPSCSAYLADVVQIVQRYGGDKKDGWQKIKFLATFARDYGASVMLGQEFTKAVATLEIPKSLEELPMCRIAFLATQLTSTGCKIKDGIGRLVSVTDVNSCKSKDNLDKFKLAERVLMTAWNDTYVNKTICSELADSQRAALFGMMCLRVVLHVLKKQRWGADTTEYTGLEAIRQAFDAEAAKFSGSTTPAAASPAHAPAAASSCNSSLAASAIRRFSLEVKAYYRHKDIENTVWQLKAVTATEAKFEKVTLRPSESSLVENKMSVPLEHDELKKWIKQPKGFKRPAIFEDACTFFPSKCEKVGDEDARAKLWTALSLTAKAEEPEGHDFEFAVNDFKIFAKQDFGKGEIKLFPMTDSISRIALQTKDTPDGAVTVKVGSHNFVINRPGSQNLVKGYINGDHKWKDLVDAKPVVVPYWWVPHAVIKDGKSEPTPNMKHDKAGAGEVTIPILTNTKAIKKGDQLVLPEPPKKKRKSN